MKYRQSTATLSCSYCTAADYVHDSCFLQAVTYLVEKVVRQLLTAVVGDPSAVLRRQVLSALYDTPALEHYLAQPDK